MGSLVTAVHLVERGSESNDSWEDHGRGATEEFQPCRLSLRCSITEMQAAKFSARKLKNSAAADRRDSHKVISILIGVRARTGPNLAEAFASVHIATGGRAPRRRPTRGPERLLP